MTRKWKLVPLINGSSTNSKVLKANNNESKQFSKSQRPQKVAQNITLKHMKTDCNFIKAFWIFRIYLKPISFSILSSAYSSFNRYNICSPYPLGHQRSISEAGIVKFTLTIPCKPIQNKENLVRCKYLSHLISLAESFYYVDYGLSIITSKVSQIILVIKT